MSQQLIRAAFDGALKTWADAQIPPIPIAFSNVPYKPITGTKHLRTYLLPADVGNVSLGITHKRYMGLYQVSIYIPDGIGPGLGDTLADAIVGLFPRGTTLVNGSLNVFIERTPQIHQGFQDVVGWMVPVSIYYRADVFT